MSLVRQFLRPFFLLTILVTGASAQAWLPTSIDPPWAAAPVARTIPLNYDSGLTTGQNGALLQEAVNELLPGDALLIGPGTYTTQARFEVFVQGTATDPIRIEAADPLNRPIITRIDLNQNIVNVGLISGGQSRYVALRNLELTGGSDLLRIYDCDNIWIDQCYMHDGTGVGIAANSNDASFLYITRNEIVRPGTAAPNATGEGIYLGQNNGVWKVSDSIIAFNHVRETQIANPGGSYQGDGIELKQGSYRNWIVGNHVHTTQFPCLVVGGTGDALAPQDENVVEKNLLYDSKNNVLQVQGDAIVRNNIAVFSQGSGAAGFQSFAAQGPVRNIRFVHNTIVNTGRAVNLNDWSGTTGMVFANNVCYSQNSLGVNFVGGSSGVESDGNVVVGQTPGASGGFSLGFGLPDFVNGSWDATKLDMTPTNGRPIDNHGSWSYREPVDYLGRARAYPADPGALESTPTLVGNTTAISNLTGGTQSFTFDAGSRHAGRRYLLVGTITDVVPAIRINSYDVPLVVDPWTSVTLAPNTGVLTSTIGNLDGQGHTSFPAMSLPPVPGLAISFWHVIIVWDTSNILKFVSNPVPLLFN